MATLVSDLQLSLAYRLGETSAPSDSTTKLQRLAWLNDAYMKVSRKRNWWWQEATSTANTNTGSTTGYAEPSDLRAFIELLIANVYYDEVPYKDNRIYTNTLGVVMLPSLRRSFKFYRFGGRYYLIPTDGNDAATHNIKYWKRVVKLVNDSDSILIPDDFAEMLPAYAEYKYWNSITQQAKAQAPKGEFDEIFTEMMAEQGRRSQGAPFAVHDPDHQFDSRDV